MMHKPSPPLRHIKTPPGAQNGGGALCHTSDSGGGHFYGGQLCSTPKPPAHFHCQKGIKSVRDPAPRRLRFFALLHTLLPALFAGAFASAFARAFAHGARASTGRVARAFNTLLLFCILFTEHNGNYWFRVVSKYPPPGIKDSGNSKGRIPDLQYPLVKNVDAMLKLI